ncbi:glycoside hydrolase family 71/99-like protein [Flavobacterium nackdongense]|uniref:Xylosidase n=1 Tax=Flavobacterium nackdongense TaxID=2547394 RepID=A0A4P6YB12_9FLAO|nr:glycoside hydrolase family 71/99-like protein [Flavobacterium nackdongense]QBN17423.1 xylosidase [Flavobacterium nackdongense]
MRLNRLSIVVMLPLFAFSILKDHVSVPAILDNSSKDTIYDESGCLYKSYDRLVMAGYQGWFAAQSDASQRGWYHYKGSCGFGPGCSCIDFWPDMREYIQQYETPFSFANGDKASLYSPYDASTVDLHFKWMKDYGIDGVHMQRFVVEINGSKLNGKRHFNKVLENALKAAAKYDRAISIMYDLSGCKKEDIAFVAEDFKELQKQFDLFNNSKNPTYLRHNGKPMVSIWGVGFNDKRKYSIADIDALVTKLKGPNNRVSVLLGVPYYWRTLVKDTQTNPELHTLIKKCDMIMPWAVGRYKIDSYNPAVLAEDIQWTKANGVDYVPLVFPGFSWGNLKKDVSQYNSTPRLKGDFLWKQIAGAKQGGAQALYVAMFDEVDEGTAIFKVLNQKNVPLNGTQEKKFVGIEDDLPTDYYLWLTGQGAKWFHNEGNYSATKPER